MLHYEIEAGLELRLPEEREAEELLQLIQKNREYLAAWLHWAEKMNTVDDALKHIRQMRSESRKEKTFLVLIRKDGRMIGRASLKYLDSPNRHTEVGYWIDRDHQGSGIVTRTTRALVDYAFRELGINRVVIRCATENRKSQAIPERLGFVREGVLRQDIFFGEGRFADAIVYSMLRQEWSKQKS